MNGRPFEWEISAEKKTPEKEASGKTTCILLANKLPGGRECDGSVVINTSKFETQVAKDTLRFETQVLGDGVSSRYLSKLLLIQQF